MAPIFHISAVDTGGRFTQRNIYISWDLPIPIDIGRTQYLVSQEH